MANKIQNLTQEELQKLREEMLSMGIPLQQATTLSLKPDEE
jgi:hypothetical protein